MPTTPQITGNAGLYYVCYRLSLLGWNVMPTARNARGIDIVAYSADGKRMRGIQVKALSKRNPVPLGKDLERFMGDFWVIVTGVGGAEPRAFVMKPAEVKAGAHKGVKEDRISYWLQPKAQDQDEFREKWSRIGRGHR